VEATSGSFDPWIGPADTLLNGFITIPLMAGTLYDIELHYYEHGGGASCRLQWSYPGQATQPIPKGQLFPN
jgi:hypothetical protein